MTSRRIMTMIIVAIAAVLPPLVAPAQQPAGVTTPLPGLLTPLLPSLTYEEWKHLPSPRLNSRWFGYEAYRAWPRGYYGLWDHDEPLEVRSARVAEYYATLPPGYINRRHPRYYAILDPTNLAAPGETGRGAAVVFAPYQQRFLDEARAGGDIIIPFAGRREEEGELHPMFAVFAAGTPPDRVAEVLLYVVGQRESAWMTGEEAIATLRSYRASLGLPTTEEYVRQIYAARTETREHPPATYEEWVYGVYDPIPLRWPHTVPDETSRARLGAFWRSQLLTQNADFNRFLGHAAIIHLGDGHDDEYEGRWLAEALAAGDLVLPFPLLIRRESDPRVGRTVPVFMVFEAGAPVTSVLAIAQQYLSERNVPPETIAAILADYLGIDAPP
jgi:hypothetical protein